MAYKRLGDALRECTLEEILEVIDYGELIGFMIRRKKLSNEDLISLILCDRFKRYIDTTASKNSYSDELYTIFDFIFEHCTIFEIQKIIKNIFRNRQITNDFIEYVYENNCNNCDLFKLMKIILFCKDTFNNWIKKDFEFSHLLIEFGIRKGYNLESLPTCVGDNVIQSTKIFEKLLQKFDCKYDSDIYYMRNVRLMKYVIKRKLGILCNSVKKSYNRNEISGLCYIYKLLYTIRIKYSDSVIPFGLIHRKSLDVIDDDIVKNKTKKIYDHVQLILMKFASKNLSKMILYFV